MYKIVKKVSHFWQKIFIICRTYVVMINYLLFIHQALKRKATGGATPVIFLSYCFISNLLQYEIYTKPPNYIPTYRGTILIIWFVSLFL
jgi:hypothetical protein